MNKTENSCNSTEKTHKLKIESKVLGTERNANHKEDRKI